MNERIAIIAWGAMADVLYATPIVRHVRKQNPDAYIAWLVRDKFAEVLENNPDINQIIKFTLPEGHSSRQDAEYVMDKEILEFANKTFNTVMDLQYWPRYSNFYERPNEDFISLRARNAKIDPNLLEDRNIVYVPKNEDVIAARAFLNEKEIVLKDTVTINHISYAATPVCSLDYYQKLADALSKQSIYTIFTGASHELIPTGPRVVDARGTPYRTWQMLIAMSDFYVGLDSGAKTLACATDTPMAILHSKDFSLKKTGCVSMGIRTKNIIELTTIPSPESLATIIESNIDVEKYEGHRHIH